MKISTETDKNVKHLIDLKREQMLKPNFEYQRAPVWTKIQKQLFIDSIFRGYAIPAFYFHHRRTAVGEYSQDILEIIDGQQRINAMYEYSEGAYDLQMNIRFPDFFQGRDFPWKDKRLSELSEEWQTSFFQQKVIIYIIETDDDNEIRDLFIRLQGGTPLKPQNKRDAWPGRFTEFILRLGGKTGVERYPGDPFFTNLARPAGDESNKRKLAAQIAMLYFHRRENGEHAFCDIKSVNIDEFYHQKIGFDSESPEAVRLRTILDELTSIFVPAGIPMPLKGYYAMHLVLLTNSLMDDYAAGWEHNLPGAFIQFDQTCLEVKQAVRNEDDLTDEQRKYRDSFVQGTNTGTDQAKVIQRRHEFFAQKMLLLLNPRKLDRRNFSRIEKELIYYRDRRTCQVCKMRDDPEGKVDWDEAEFHHITPHNAGGRSTLDNGALVHQQCHPESEQDVREFREWWNRMKEQNAHAQEEEEEHEAGHWNRFPPPEGTECRFTYGDTIYNGKIEDKKLQVGDEDYTSFSGASHGITNTFRNGWRDWELKLPGQNDWILADDWRRGHV